MIKCLWIVIELHMLAVKLENGCIPKRYFATSKLANWIVIQAFFLSYKDKKINESIRFKVRWESA